MRKEFVSAVSHELKTPLGIIRGFAEGVRDDVFEDSAYYLDVIIDETEKMDALVVDMLELSKLESENFQINPTYFDLYNLIEFVKKKFEYSLLDKNLSVELIKHTRLSICYGDEFRIEQVLTNFLSNALKFTEKEGKIKITTKLVQEKNEITNEVNLAAQVLVTDSGVGIPDNEIDKVFNKYEQTEAGKNATLKGTGLGLYWVKELIKYHGGKISVQSEGINHGTTFQIELPIYQSYKKRYIKNLLKISKKYQDNSDENNE